MDSNELEKERGITIFSKNASVNYKGVKINIVDTPGHADFGGEVERIMRMVDGVILLIDAKEGPMPQTKFVLRKAIQAGHRIIVVVNKIDRNDARPEWALDQTYNLFFELGANEQQIDFPVIYASAVQGKAGLTPDLSVMENVTPLFDTVVNYIQPPQVNLTAPLQMLTVNLVNDNYKGKLAIGRLYSGTLKKGMWVAHIARDRSIRKVQLSSLLLFSGLGRIDAEEAQAGDIVAIGGIPDVSIGETIADLENPIALPSIKIDEPTIKMTFAVNTSPFMGQDGDKTTSRNLNERLQKEMETDVALAVSQADSADRWTVAGRGELHLSIFIEKMRREGFELEVSKPQVIFKEENGKKLEPMELLTVEVPSDYAGTAIELLGKRLGVMKDMKVDGVTTIMEFSVPTRGLIGIRNEFLTLTRGMGIMNPLFAGYEEYKGEFRSSEHGSIVASETGLSNSYGLTTAQGRGQLFIGPGVPVYAGMVVGENAKAEDMKVNVCKTKQLNNFRSKNEGVEEKLEVPKELTLEYALSYIGDDELVEVTPKNVRVRKTYLTELARKQAKDNKGY